MPFPITQPDPLLAFNNDPLDWQNLMGQQQPIQEQAAQNVAAGQPANLPPLNPQEEQSLFSRIGNNTLGGIGYIGGLLDKYTGGRAVRGLLGGHPRELMSLLPGSDAFGLTDPADAVSGRDLTNNMGLTAPGSDSLGDTALGIGAEMLLSPATYLSFGGSALTEAGEQAAKLGSSLPLMKRLAGVSSVADLGPGVGEAAARMGVDPTTLLNQPLGGLAKIGIPFGPSTVLGAGQGGINALHAAGNAARTVADLPGISTLTHPAESLWGAVGEPIVRNANALFNYQVRGATSAAGQAAARAMTEGERSGLQDVKGVAINATRGLNDVGALDQNSLIRGIAEAAPGSASPLNAQGQAINQSVGAMTDSLDALQNEGAALGFNAPKLQDKFIKYFPRDMLEPDINTAGFGGRMKQFNTKPSALEAREDILRNIPGGTNALNELSVDNDFSGINGRFGPTGGFPSGTAPTTPLQRQAMIRAKYMGLSPQDEANIQAAVAKQGSGLPLTSDEQLSLSLWQQSQGLERWAADLDPKRALQSNPVPFFGNSPVQDYASTAASTVRRNQAGKAIIGMFGDYAKPAAEAGPNWVPLGKAFQQAGFDNQWAAIQNMASRLGVAPLSVADHYVPPEVAADASRFLSGFQTPEGLKPLVSAIDWMTNLTKTFQTSPWPAFHMRNIVSGLFANWMQHSNDPRYSPLNPLSWIKPVQDAMSFIKGGVVQGAKDMPVFKGMGLTDEQATKQIGNLAAQYGATGQGMGMASEGLTGAEQAAGMAKKIPGMVPFEGFGSAMKSAIPHSWDEANPLNVVGVGANRDVNSVVKAGRKVGDATEEINRLSSFIAQLRQGYDPATAAMRTRAAHVDYGALSPFEKNIMRRAVPFYSYTRGIVPFVLHNLTENPGGLGGRTAMAAHSLRDNGDGFVPDYLGNGLAIPVGKEQDGTQRFLTKIDNPVEAASSLINGGSLGDSMMGLLGQMNPLIKAPLEYATGKQFYTGRNLGDLYPMTGSTLVDQALMNSPLSRAATTYRTLTDERKWEHPLALLTNLGTGVRMSDIDVERQKDLAARDYLNKRLTGEQGIGRYETIYPRPEAIGSLTPEQIALLRLNKTLDKRVHEKTIANKKVGVFRGQ